MPWASLKSLKKCVDAAVKAVPDMKTGEVFSQENQVHVGNSDFSKPLDMIVLSDDTVFLQFSTVDKDKAWFTEILRKWNVHNTVKSASSKQVKAAMIEHDLTAAEAVEAIKQFKSKAKAAKK